MKIVISSGHGLHVPGASAILDEVEEARAVVPEVAKVLRANGHEVIEFHDDTSQSQDENLKTIVNFHNSQGPHDIDVSVHFNAYIPTTGGRGTEVLYVTQQAIATKVSAAIAAASGLIDRGAHKRSDLYFLNKTAAPAILIEVCFCDAAADADIYEEHFTEICGAIADVAEPADPDAPVVLKARGKVSWFGGPDDDGVAPDEGLAFIYSVDDKPDLFLPEQPDGTTGLARRLDPAEPYFALRWDYCQFPKEFLRGPAKAQVRAPKTGMEFMAHPADWGPHCSTGRVADISPGLMDALGIETDDEIEIEYPV
jgi:N-acetylmuramoyl-L-alanine amidase